MLPRLSRKPDDIAPPRIEERALDVFEQLETHGALSTAHLFALVCPKVKNSADFSDLLQQLYHHGYLDRPDKLNHPRAFSEQLVYRLEDKGRIALRNARDFPTLRRIPSSDVAHDYLTSLITAGVAIAAKAAGFRFISWIEILKRAPASSLTQKKKGTRLTPFHVPASVHKIVDGKQWSFEKHICPDALFGIDYGNTEAFFALEADRNTEDGRSSDPSKNSLVSKLLRYQDAVQSKRFMQHFGISNIKVLFVTMPESRVDFLLELIEEHFKLPAKIGGARGCTYIAATHVQYFRDYYTPPIMADLFTREWKTAGVAPFVMEGKW